MLILRKLIIISKIERKFKRLRSNMKSKLQATVSLKDLPNSSIRAVFILENGISKIL